MPGPHAIGNNIMRLFRPQSQGGEGFGAEEVSRMQYSFKMMSNEALSDDNREVESYQSDGADGGAGTELSVCGGKGKRRGMGGYSSRAF